MNNTHLISIQYIYKNMKNRTFGAFLDFPPIPISFCCEEGRSEQPVSFMIWTGEKKPHHGMSTPFRERRLQLLPV